MDKFNTKELEALLKRLERAENNSVEYGFFPESKYSGKTSFGGDNDHYVAQVALWQEEGTKGSDNRQRIPPRPFFKAHTKRVGNYDDPTGRAVIDALAASINEIICRKYSVNMFDWTGKILVDTLRNEILDWANPPNSPITIQQKGFNDPLIHTGQMHDSVKYKKRRKKKVKTDA